MKSDDELKERKSKSELKREAEAAQALGKALVDLPAAQFKVLIGKADLPDTLHEALVECRAIKSHEAHRRKMQYIGKLMRDVELEPIQRLITQVKRSGDIATAQLHQIERWRDRLLTGGQGVLEELLQTCPQADATHLQNLIDSARREAEHKQPPRAARLLFKYLRELFNE